MCQRITGLFPPEKFAELLHGYELWKTGILNMKVTEPDPGLRGRQRMRFIAKQRMLMEWKEELESQMKEDRHAA